VEEFSKRVYDTFSLPAGLYESLRIIIGEGEGKNWWCVVFPELCLPATSEGFEETASCAGFPDALTAALEGEEGYEIRFFLLDVLGRLENLIHRV
jgi:stage II sporulation protein R